MESTRRGIVAAFDNRAEGSRFAGLIGRCTGGACRRCGDLCPINADRWIKTTRPQIVSSLEAFDGPMLTMRYIKPSWGRRRGLLSAPPLTLLDPARIGGKEDVRVSQQAIEKALRRSLDKLVPRVMAVGMIDAWYGHKRWEIGVSLIIAGTTKSAIRDAFPAGNIDFGDAANARKSVLVVMRKSHVAKRMPPIDALSDVPLSRQLEYYRWLASMDQNARLFRYGCDRYFNPLLKATKPIEHRERKHRPYPQQLVPFMFGNR